MFITEKRYLSPLSALQCGPGQQSWILGELAMSRPWFLVTLLQYDPDDADCAFKRTFFTSSVEQVEAWAQEGITGELRFKSASIVTPDTKNGTSTWQIEPLASLWFADEPAGPPGYL